ncbi:hypothetical protein MMC15_003328 [Xylographa vitiligo]|nr:hypothetical protein [Xylographa vitiligo]
MSSCSTYISPNRAYTPCGPNGHASYTFSMIVYHSYTATRRAINSEIQPRLLIGCKHVPSAIPLFGSAIAKTKLLDIVHFQHYSTPSRTWHSNSTAQPERGPVAVNGLGARPGDVDGDKATPSKETSRHQIALVEHPGHAAEPPGAIESMGEPVVGHEWGEEIAHGCVVIGTKDGGAVESLYWTVEIIG